MTLQQHARGYLFDKLKSKGKFNVYKDPSITDIENMQREMANVLEFVPCELFEAGKAGLIEDPNNYCKRVKNPVVVLDGPMAKPQKRDNFNATQYKSYKDDVAFHTEQEFWNNKIIKTLMELFPGQFSGLKAAPGIMKTGAKGREYINHVIANNTAATPGRTAILRNLGLT